MINAIDYLPPKQRIPDQQIYDLVHKIMKEGKIKGKSHQGGEIREIYGHKMVFKMENGFPITTMRDFTNGFYGSMGEHIAFLNGARTLEKLKSYGCPEIFWKDWVTKERCDIFGLEEFDLGPGSYGPGWTHVPTPDGNFFNQIENVQNQIREMPFIRTHVIDPWIPYYAASANKKFPRKVVVAPCHGWIRVIVHEDTRTLSVIHKQRSADVLVGLMGNITQYAGFGLMLATSIDYKFDELIYFIDDAHIYENQYDYVDILMPRTPRIYPTVTLSSKKERVQDYRKQDFILEDYNPHPKLKVPTPI